MTNKLAPGSTIYFIGIAGTGMAAVAGLLQEAGYRVKGSDAAIYPPMSDMLAELNIPVATPYDPQNIVAAKPDLIVVANALSRGHPELEFALSEGLAYTSFPKLLGDLVLSQSTSVVVAGTHGKTTTTALLAFLLTELHHQPGYLIGGVPRDLASAFSLGNRKVFVIEGDEYDTAFFDKGSKFLHYHPRFAILNNLEFDHADIFKDLAAIEGQFTKFVGLVENHRNLVVNVDDPGMRSLVTRLGIIDEITSVSGLGQHNDASLVVQSAGAITTKAGSQSANWQLRLKSEVFGSFDLETQLTGVHNASNIAHAIGLLGRLQQEELIGKISIPDLQAIVVRFRGVKRRLEHLNSWNNIDIYEDFAHHPTAVGLVLDGFRASHPGRRILAAFEPKNATSRRNVFTEHFAQSLGKADLVFIGKCPEDSRIAPDQRMDTGKLAKLIGERAIACAENDELGEKLAAAARPGDAIIFMSAGSFSGIQHRLITMIQHGGSK